ncbi:ABC transporter substrate-binding protein [Nguyenibacter sp. L1]|uniref:ABC transporter substrate-binding protein n=1 Tax=Nguyenibacter sp. L1 TaxID=3049350 RepID=UPI002B4A19B0|nr:ABC transporter substrate-binding protein [Nguyenibacter sp. L1]WRH86842.1 ABC transporter substrate-binding protein [Nguyenibacter sp. L1]
MAGLATGGARGAVPSAVPVAAPVRGGHLRVAGAVGSTAETLDPARLSMATDYVRGHMFYDGLTALDDALVVHPALAETIESDDLTTWHIRLRRDVRFHDGAPLGAADVVFSLARHKIPSVGAQQYMLAQTMDTIRATGPRDVEIVLTAPNVDFPAILAMSNFAIIRDGTGRFETANGTGPFTCAEFVPGIRTLGRRNAAFWGDGPFVDSIELIAIPDEMARHNALMSGDVDLIASVNPRLVRMVQVGGFGLMESPVGTYTDLAIRLDTPLARAPGLVEAIKCLLDREQIRRSVFLGYSRLGNDQPIAPESPYCNHDLPPAVHDPDRARFLLRRGGFLGERIPLVCSPAALGSVDIAVLLQYAARRIGQDLAVRRVPADGYWTQYWMKTPFGFGNVNPRPAPSLIFEMGFASASPWNESRWRDPRFDAMLAEARATRDDARRRQLYGDMQAMIKGGSGVCIPNFTTSLDGYAPHVRGLRPSQAGQLMGYDFARFVWLDGGGA